MLWKTSAAIRSSHVYRPFARSNTVAGQADYGAEPTSREFFNRLTRYRLRSEVRRNPVPMRPQISPSTSSTVFRGMSPAPVLGIGAGVPGGGGSAASSCSNWGERRSRSWVIRPFLTVKVAWTVNGWDVGGILPPLRVTSFSAVSGPVVRRLASSTWGQGGLPGHWPAPTPQVLSSRLLEWGPTTIRHVGSINDSTPATSPRFIASVRASTTAAGSVGPPVCAMAPVAARKVASMIASASQARDTCEHGVFPAAVGKWRFIVDRLCDGINSGGIIAIKGGKPTIGARLQRLRACVYNGAPVLVPRKHGMRCLTTLI